MKTGAYLRLAALGLAAGAGLAQAAWDIDQVLPAQTRNDFRPQQVVAIPGGGFWAAGTGVDGYPALVRYDAAGRSQAVHFQWNGDGDVLERRATMTPLTDGGLLVTGATGGAERIDAAGRSRWRGGVFSCTDTSATPDGGYWCVDFQARVTRVGPDGVANEPLAPEDLGFGAAAGSQVPALRVLARGTAGDVLLYGGTLEQVSSGVQDTRARIVALDVHGHVQWTWRNDALGTVIRHLYTNSNGDIFGVGRSGETTGDGRYAVSLTAQGTRRWQATAPSSSPSPDVYVDGHVVGNDLYVLEDVPGESPVLLHYSGGSSAATARLSGFDTVRAFAPAPPTRAETDLVVVGIIPETGNPFGRPRYARYALDGTLIGTYADRTAISGFARLDDGATLLTSYSGAGAHYHFERFGPGGDVQTAPDTTDVLVQPTEVIAHAVTGDGRLYVASRANYQAQTYISAYDAQGGHSWTIPVDATLQIRQVGAGAGRVCAALGAQFGASTAQPAVTCVRATDGTALWTTPYAGADNDHAELRIADDGGLQLISYGDRVNIASVGYRAQFSAQGALQGETTLTFMPGPGLTTADLAAAGRTEPFGPLTVALLAPNAATPSLVPLSIDDFRDSSATLAAAGSTGVVVVGHCVGGTDDDVCTNYIERSTGQSLWQQRLTGAPHGRYAVTATADAIYLAGFYASSSSPTPDNVATTRVLCLARTTGAVAWQRTLTYATDNVDGSLRIDPANGRVLLVERQPRVARLVALDAGSGATLAERVEACVACAIPDDGLDAAGNLRLLASEYDVTAGRVARWRVARAPTRDVPAARVDQRGINGAWYADYTAGQGFFFDYLPDNAVFFAAWFTFDPWNAYVPTLPTGPHAQHWYTLQAVVAPDAREVTLVRATTVGGAFAAPPKVAAHADGQAKLRFSDCSHATLSYQPDPLLDPNYYRAITLTRLSPAVTDCTLADGSVQHVATTPARGFDARMTGSWYDPATEGQGLEFTVQPSGIFFAGWFTFDPAGASDDATQQHWFTLQGDLAQAQDGVVSVPIVQTVGGSFDAEPTADIYVVGTATLRVHGCDRADLEYRFDPGELAGSYAGRSGTVALQKIGGCGP